MRNSGISHGKIGLMTQNTKDIKIERYMPARPGKVWMAWTEPDMVAKWWNPFPNGTSEVQELDVAPGGRGKINAKDPQGGESLVFLLNYKGVVPGKEIIFTVRDKEEAPESPEMKVQFEPAEDGTETKLIFDSPKVPADMYEDALAGWHAFFDKLEDAVTGDSSDLLFEGGEGINIREAGSEEE